MREQELMGGYRDSETADTEITLGVGKLLGLFFGLVILCGLSLGTGYWLGRNSAKQPLSAAGSVPVPAMAPANQTPSSAGKPGAAQLPPPPAQPKASDCASGDNCASQTAAAPSPADLTFYQAVRQKDDSHPQLTPPVAASHPPAAAAQNTLGAGYLVQIAAVRNQDDAKLLNDALQKQQYPVVVTQPGDKLFHVQVGPYADIKEAEAIRTRLIGAGYNAILKH